MKTTLSILAAAFALVATAAGQADAFLYQEWTDKDGKTITARLSKLEGKKITLQVKKGGKRYTLDRAKLSETSNKVIDELQAAVAQQIASGQIDTSVIYQGAALGLGDKLAGKLHDRKLAFTVTDIRIETDKKAAFLGLDDALFLKIYAPSGREYFEKQDVLLHRPSNKSRIDPRGRRVNEEARRVAADGGQFTVHFSNKMIFEFGQVGVSDGIIVHQ